MIKKILVVVAFFITVSGMSQETIKTMFYNLLEYPTAAPSGRDQILKSILDVYEPDVFMVCELESPEGADSILNVSLNSDGEEYSAFPFFDNTSSEADLQNLLFYRSNMFTVETSQIISTTVRDINRYQLKLNTEDAGTDPVIIDFFVTHLKSSQGSANENLRLDMVTAFTDVLETIDPNSYVIFTGDLNLYDAEEPAYLELLDPTNAIKMVDPIDTPGDWHNNIDFQNLHTQSTRQSSGGFGAGAGGGMDDRFDFILVSENMLTDPKLQYSPGSYKAYGNNGNCYDNDVNAAECTGEFQQSLRNQLYNMSDHLPVIMQLQTDQNIILANEDVTYFQNTIRLEKTIISTEVRLEFSQQPILPISVEVYNTIGQKLIETTLTTGNKSINVSGLSNGIYYIKTSISNSQTLKFLKAS